MVKVLQKPTLNICVNFTVFLKKVTHCVTKGKLDNLQAGLAGAIMAAIASKIPVPDVPDDDSPVETPSVAAMLIRAMAPSVKVHGKWIAQAGIGILHLPGYVVHLLPTVASMSESEMFMGSSTVLADGAPCSTIMHPALSCNLAGIPPPPRKGKAKLRKLLMLPTTLLTIITSAGKPVLVGGPPTIDLFQMGIKLGLKRLGKLKKAGKTKFLSHLAHKAIDKMKINPKLAKILKNRACKMFREPVDAATGRVYHTNTDFELPGPIPIVWERTYYSDAEVDGPLGYNWHHSYNMGIRELVDDIILFRQRDGRESFFPTLAIGETYYDRKEQLTWSNDRNGYLLEDNDGMLYRFNGGKNRHEYRMLSEISTKDGHRIRFRYGGRGELIEITDSRNVRISVDNDMEGRVIRVSTYLGLEETDLVRYRYDESGNMIETKDALDVSKHFYYDGHLLTKLTNRSGMSFYWEYEGKGNNSRCVHTWGDGGVMEHFVKYADGITKETNGLGHTTEYYHDEDKLIYKIVDANGGITRQLYNEHQELEVIVNPEGLSVKTEFDDYGNPLNITDENGNTTSYKYDTLRNLTAMTTPGGKIFTWDYDEYNRVAKRTTPSGETYTYTYENGNLKKITDRQGAEYILTFNGFYFSNK
jgi:YD repeat-containing protein